MSHAWPSYADCSSSSLASDELLVMYVYHSIRYMPSNAYLVLPILTRDDAYVMYVNIYIN